ncbi:hypothetical protein [uncultured Variovorax sp.]|uniref:hypothetical protein n=1 Tax=uncultured Variovorax sp. TaxID=114708 RepID=UPI002639A418|nr:hypothetical protein [uncultured Variovorax sp.]
MVKTTTAIKRTVLAPKPEGSRGKATDVTILRSFQFATREPGALHFQDTLVTIEGLPMRDRPEDLAWGVHGSRAINDASVLYSRAALDRSKLLYEIDLSLRVSHLRQSTTSVSEQIARDSGLLATSRMRSDYQKEVRDTVLGYIEPKVTPDVMKRVTELDLDALLIQFPSAVWRFMRERDWLHAVIHPALVRVADASGQQPAVMARLQIITFRIDPLRIEHATVRQLPDVLVTI